MWPLEMFQIVQMLTAVCRLMLINVLGMRDESRKNFFAGHILNNAHLFTRVSLMNIPHYQ
jgi:hypothetical protein